MGYFNSKSGSLEEATKDLTKYINDSAYQQMFKKELEKTGKGLASMSDQEKKDFFNKMDSKYKKESEGKGKTMSGETKTKVDPEPKITYNK